MKRRIFLVCLFYCFFRLPIYESIAAIFWQSASYVFFSCFNPDLRQACTRQFFSDDLPTKFYSPPPPPTNCFFVSFCLALSDFIYFFNDQFFLFLLFQCFDLRFTTIINCSQTKFVAIISVLWSYVIFRLTDFSSDPFDFSSPKTRINRQRPEGIKFS